MGDEVRINAMTLAEQLNKVEPFAVRFGYNHRGEITLTPAQAQALLVWIHRHFPPVESQAIARECLEDTKTSVYNKIAAVKEYRTRTKASLKEAHDAIILALETKGE